jgi:hypothetical protein
MPGIHPKSALTVLGSAPAIDVIISAAKLQLLMFELDVVGIYTEDRCGAD